MVAILSKGENNIAVIHLDLSQEQLYKKVKTHVLSEELGKFYPAKEDYYDIHISEKEVMGKTGFQVTIFDRDTGLTHMEEYFLEMFDLDIDSLFVRLWRKFCR